jgi:hypothetical protein
MKSCNTSVAQMLCMIDDIKYQLQELEMTVHNTLAFQSDKISELESLANPFTDEGQAICNTRRENYER